MSNGEETQQQAQPAETEAPKFAPGDSLEDTAKKLFFVADEAGEATAARDGNTVTLNYPDGSMITARFESRPGSHAAVGTLTATEEEKKAANERSAALKKREEERIQEAESRKAQLQKAKEPANA